MLSDYQSRTRLLIGDETAARLSGVRVIVFGVGGVGSWCVEGLVRSGVRRLTIVDQDRVCPSNVNRQLMATVNTVGRVKVDALKEHLLTISPEAEIDAVSALVFGPLSWLVMLAIAVGTSFIATFLPVYSIAKRKPVESIRSL